MPKKTIKEKDTYCHDIADTIEGWNALALRMEELRKRADKIQLSLFMTEEDIAHLLSIHKGWLSGRRLSGKPPFFYKFGTGKKAPIRYSLLEVMDYLTMCCRRTSTTHDDSFDLESIEKEYLSKYKI